MIIQPKIRGFICTTAHPVGCAQNVIEQINYVKAQQPIVNGPKRVLVIGSSTGYGLATRITAAFGGSQAQTIGVFFEKESDGKKTATAGFYNSVAFEQQAQKQGIYAKSFNGDAFSDEIKAKVIETIKKDWGAVDLVIYSLASPRRQHPKTGEISRSVLKPLGKPYTNTSIDMNTDTLEEVTLQTATQEEIDQTIAVMGGEDWSFWIEALEKENLLADNFLTVAYSYVGPRVTQAVYRNGTIGAAKAHLEATAKELDEHLRKKGGRALVSVNKALVTQASSAIPFIPLYYVILTKVLKEKGIEENTIEQIYRLFASKLYSGNEIEVDDQGLVRIDDFELREDVQEQVDKHWENLTQENLKDVADLEGYHKDFLHLFGFGFDGVDYQADVDPQLKLPSGS